jgi:hypothetical protein
VRLRVRVLRRATRIDRRAASRYRTVAINAKVYQNIVGWQNGLGSMPMLGSLFQEYIV